MIKYLFVFLFSINVHAGGVIHYTEEFPPFNYLDKDEKVTGYSIDLLNKAFDYMKLKEDEREIRLVPWARAYRNAQKEGQSNMVFSTTRVPQRETLFKWVGPIKSTGGVVFSVKGKADIKDIKSISGNRVLVIRDDVGGFLMKEAGHPEENLVKESTVEKILAKLSNPKSSIEYWAYDKLVGLYLIKKLGYKNSDFKIVYEFPTNAMFYAFNKSVDDETVQKYQKAIDKVREDKKFMESLEEKYFK